MVGSRESRSIVLLSDIRSYDLYIPLSILSIGTIAASRGYTVHIIDGQMETDVSGRLRDLLPSAELLGVSSHTGPSIRTVLEALKICRSEFPGVPTIWGGYHATQAYRSILREGLVDVVVKGAGEWAFEKILDLIEAFEFENETKRGEIANIAFVNRTGELVDNKIRAVDIGQLPAMNYELIDLGTYLAKKSTIQFISSYGCPYACTFCAEPSQSLRRWKAMGVDRMCDELSNLWDRYAPGKISLIDPNFSTSPDRVAALVKRMEERGLFVRLSATMRGRDVCMIAERIGLERLRAVGFSTVFIGIESGSNRVLRQLKKAATADDMLRACVLLDKAGIKVKSSFMHDLPGETEKDSSETFELVEKIAPLNNRQSHHFYMPYPATEMYESVFATEDGFADLRQSEWAETSTFQSSAVWSGRPAFRRRVYERLRELHMKYPISIPDLVMRRLDEESQDAVYRFVDHVNSEEAYRREGSNG